MPLHPAAPDDLGGLLDAFEQTVQAVVDLGWGCRPEDFDKPSEVPDWSVRGQVSQVLAIEKAFAQLLRDPRPAAAGDDPSLRFPRLVTVDVDARQHWEGRSIVSELADFHPEHMEVIRTFATDLDADLSDAFGPGATLRDQLRRRIADVWIREQDVRVALDAPGDLDSPAAAVYTGAVLTALPRVAARSAGIPPGQVIVIDVTGPVRGRAGVRVVYGEDGRPYGEALFSGQDRVDGEGDVPPEVTTVQLTTEALTRRAADRRSTEAIHFSVTGDEAAARHLLDALVVLP